MKSLNIHRTWLIAVGLLAVALYVGIPRVTATEKRMANATQDSLKPVVSFANLADQKGRSVALFTEAARVMQSPRCLNCHPVTRTPTQGDNLEPHQPPIVANAEGQGPPGLACSTCHQTDNVRTFGDPIASVPGHHPWALAPPSMAWQGLSVGEICEQLKDKKRNGNRTLEEIHKHLAEDGLVGWAWHPGKGRKPAPGTQQQFGALIQAWIETGAHCPGN
ncbi:Isoquinoline 1-oxidoreductase subunit [Microbulbifer hainanensis]|uniref:Isoquinoline 1-oxidoreductase subunit n=1 Tax=Microbulbifer hainanensis TaxID=2735675 RepID=UPI001866F869|nr:Isoquinoline 1-oxidoreductase subunit [Microbulbifer hainanensis]